MAEKESSMSEVKKAIIGVITLAITTAGGLLIANMEKIIGGEEDKPAVKTEQVAPPKQDIIINIPEQKKDTIVKKVYVKPIVKKTQTEKRKAEGLDW